MDAPTVRSEVPRALVDVTSAGSCHTNLLDRDSRYGPKKVEAPGDVAGGLVIVELGMALGAYPLTRYIRSYLTKNGRPSQYRYRTVTGHTAVSGVSRRYPLY